MPVTELAINVCSQLLLSLLTVEMLLLGSDHLLGGGLADGLGEALAGDAVPRGQQPVVDGLSRHTVPAVTLLFSERASTDDVTHCLPKLIELFPRVYTGERTSARKNRARPTITRGILETHSREKRVKSATVRTAKTSERCVGVSDTLLTSHRTRCDTPRHGATTRPDTTNSGHGNRPRDAAW